MSADWAIISGHSWSRSMTDQEIRKALESFFSEREGEELLDEIDSIDLVDEGILDSLDFLSLAAYIEKTCGVKLELTDEGTFKAMRNIGSLQRLVSSMTPDI